MSTVAISCAPLPDIAMAMREPKTPGWPVNDLTMSFAKSCTASRTSAPRYTFESWAVSPRAVT